MLGQGIHGTVWEAVLKRNCRQVAIKFLHRKHLEDLESTDPSQRAQAKHFSLAFTNEIQLLEALCGHPNIIEILGRASDYSQVILEMAETDLDQYLKDCVRKHELVSLERCHAWFQDILSGVAYIHEIGVCARTNCRVFKI
jgi:serine/threonine protein kinase